MTKYFTCSECGDDLPARDLSSGSFKAAGTDTRSQALPETAQVCRWCEEEEAGDEEDSQAPVYLYSDPDVARLTHRDPGKWAAQQQNW